MKILKKIGKIILVMILLISASIGNAGTHVKAATFPISRANIYSKGNYNAHLKYSNFYIYVEYTVYKKDGIEYPAYCISPGIDGVGEIETYDVTVDSLINDVAIWRAVTNGFPYVSPASLGLQSDAEAFMATKQAIYCIIYGRNAAWYEALNEQGARIKRAIIQILERAKSSNEGKPSGTIELEAQNNDWQIDPNLDGYVYKTFDIKASTGFDTYSVQLNGNYPKESLILSTNNETKTEFGQGEKFKIAISLRDMTKSGDFTINVSSKLKTKPVFYGKAPRADWQNYALTASVYEDATGSKNLSYFENTTNILIKKIEESTGKPIEGVEFQILDKNKNTVYTDLLTDKKGEISVNNMIPGRYYLEEVRTKEGYVKYDKLIAFDLKLNQDLTITVNNSKEKVTEYSSSKQNITVGKQSEKLDIKENTENITKSEKEKNISILEHTSNIKENTQKENSKIVVKEANVNKNLNKQNANIDLNNVNINKNNNIQNMNVNINNTNINENNNVQNANESIQNTNKNVNTQALNINTQIQNSNTQNNISSLNGVVKLPKTGM